MKRAIEWLGVVALGAFAGAVIVVFAFGTLAAFGVLPR